MPEAHTRGSVLVVDDEPTIGEVVSALPERAGYETRVAADGLAALEAVAERAAGPDRARPDAARHRRARGDAPRARPTGPRERDHPAHRQGRGVRPRRSGCGSAPTTTWSSRSRPPSWSRAWTPCCAASTPSRDRRAAAALRRARDRPGRARACASTASEVALTAREFDLLLFLARHPGQRVHARAADGPRLAVRVLHRHLDGDRAHPPAAGQARARPGAPRWIETVWGVGYRFAP